MQTTWTTGAQARLTSYLQTHKLKSEPGSRQMPCSIQAINIALSGKPSTVVPECMSEVLGSFIITIQDAIPNELLNSPEWKQMLPQAAGTHRDLERERSQAITDWMWDRVLPQVTPVLGDPAFTKPWETMLKYRTRQSTRTAEQPLIYHGSTEPHGKHYQAGETAHSANRVLRYLDRDILPSAALTVGLAASHAARTVPDPVGFWTTVGPISLIDSLIDMNSTTAAATSR